MIKWKGNFTRSVGMRAPLLICILVITLLPLMVQARFMSGFFRKSRIEESMIEAQNKCLMLANRMRSSDYINGALSNTGNPSLDAELNVIADLFNGRIVVIDSSYRIIRDTFEVAKGRFWRRATYRVLCARRSAGSRMWISRGRNSYPMYPMS